MKRTTEKPVIVMLMHDPQGMLFPHLNAITPHLKSLFQRAVLSVAPITRMKQAAAVERLAEDDFFDLLQHESDLPVGDDLRLLYAYAANRCAPETILHLCFVDRVAFALLSEYQAQFIADIQQLQAEQTPLIFERSPRAWASHPDNYYQLETMVTQVGTLLLGQRFDFTWCHVAVQAGRLRQAMPAVTKSDFRMCAELVLALQDSLVMRPVDWLAWEDPFLYAVDGKQLKQAREEDRKETRKRLHYVLPMIQLLYEQAGGYQWTGLRAEKT